MQLEFDFFTPYHSILDMVADRYSEEPCYEHPDLWSLFCYMSDRYPYGSSVSVWTVRDVADWANFKIRQTQGDN